MVVASGSRIISRSLLYLFHRQSSISAIERNSFVQYNLLRRSSIRSCYASFTFFRNSIFSDDLKSGTFGFAFGGMRWLSVWPDMRSSSFELKADRDAVRFSFGVSRVGSNFVEGSSLEEGEEIVKKKKMSRKEKLNQLRFYRLKAKKKMKSPNPEVRIRYKLGKAKRKEAWLIEKLRKFELPKAPTETHDPESLTEEERFYLKRTGEKKKHYVPVGRRGVFGGVVLNMHLHWKNHETVKVVCKPCKPGQIHEIAEELARLSKGVVIDIKPDNIIIFYRGRNYVQPEVMSPPDTLSKNKAMEKYKYEQSLEHTSQFIERLENELEEYLEHVAQYRKQKDNAPKNFAANT